MEKLTVKDVNVKGKRVFNRVDFNVPLDKKTGKVSDDSRIKAALPTIKYLIDHEAKVILASHLGRPDGKVVESMRMAPVAEKLGELLGKPIIYVKEITGSEVESATKAMDPGDIMLIENLRFTPGEEANDPTFAKQLANLADLYVDDAFAAAHRAHASISGITKFLPAYTGLLMEKEINTLSKILENPEHPFCALLGGVKVSDKVGLLQNIVDKVDCFLIGGAMAATFLKAKNSAIQIGTSLFEPEKVPVAAEILAKAEKNKVKVFLPLDAVVANDKLDPASARVVDVKAIPADMKIVDIGPKTIAEYTKQLQACKTVFWNGPMGIYETPQFAEGTRRMAEALASLKGATTVIGGGNTGEVVEQMGLAPKMTFVSTGGGASLTFLNGEKMPGVESLQDRKVSEAAR
jgi:phosphoglycerate kinase